jgi:FkbM family methyltransferase
MKELNLFTETKKLGIDIKRCCEVGVFYASTCHLRGFAEAGVPTMLVEADPKCVADLRAAFGARGNVQIVPNAIWHERTELTFYRANASTYVGSVSESPALVNDSYKPKEEDAFRVTAVLFSDVDPADLDLVLIDVEGAEYNVLQTMKSRPKVLSLELRAGRYLNPNYTKIVAWLEQNDYRLWFHNNTDSVYIRSDVAIPFAKSLKYRAISAAADVRQAWKRTKAVLRGQKVMRA